MSMFVVKRDRMQMIALAVLLVAAVMVLGGLLRGGYERHAGEDEAVGTEAPVWSEGSMSTDPEDLPEGNSFLEMRLERERTRSMQVEILREIVNNPNSTEGAREQAQGRLMEISDKLAGEAEAEQLITALDFEDALVYLLQEDALVLVKCKELDDTAVARIASIVSRVTGLSWEKIAVRLSP